MTSNWDWDERVAQLKAEGSTVIAPNGLRICCIRHDGTLMENEHADHPTYMFPVTVDYVGKDPEFGMLVNGLGEHHLPEPDMLEGMKHEDHAVIYTDGWVVMTLYEYCYFLFTMGKGRCAAAPSWYDQKDWEMNPESIERCRKWCKEHPELAPRLEEPEESAAENLPGNPGRST